MTGMGALFTAVAGGLAIAVGAAGALGATSLPLPCPFSAGWQVERRIELPRRNDRGEVLGGFSAARYSPEDDTLLLLSDLPGGAVTRWVGLARGAHPTLQAVIPLRSGPSGRLPAAIDGEGLVLLDGRWWVASEGRRSSDRPAQLLRFDPADGSLLGSWEPPASWRQAEGRGLASNGGPESLLLLPGAQPSQPAALLMAAEFPLLQDPPAQVRLLRWSWAPGEAPARVDPQPRPQGALQLPRGEGWGLTDLMLAGPGRLLGLLRRFEPPDRWQIRLALYPLPSAGSSAAAAPLAVWDLIAAGLDPDNWEALSPGPPLPDGRPTLLLVSDDNLSPLQANRLALLSANGGGACPSPP
jgi:hypothetical protein